MIPALVCLHLILFFLTSLSGAEEAKSCGSPGRPYEGIVRNLKDAYVEGETVIYECHPRDDIVRKRICNNGTWTGPLPICRKRIVPNVLTSSGEVIGYENALDLNRSTCASTGRSSDGRLYWQARLDKPYVIFFVGFWTEGEENSTENEGIRVKIPTSEGEKELDAALVVNIGGRQLYGVSFAEVVVYNFTSDRVIIEDADSTRTNLSLCSIWIIPATKCGDPEVPLHGWIEYSNNNRTVTYYCDDGYEPFGDVQRYCDQFSFWNGDQLQCVRSSRKETSQSSGVCGMPGRPDNSILMNTKIKYTTGDSVSYACESGYFQLPSKDVKRTCQNGSWTGKLPRCVRPLKMDKANFTSSGDMIGNINSVHDWNLRTCISTTRNESLYWRIRLDKSYHIVALLVVPEQSEDAAQNSSFKITVSKDGKGVPWTMQLKFINRTEKTAKSPELSIPGSNIPSDDFVYYLEDGELNLRDTLLVEDLAPHSRLLSICEIAIVITGCGEPEIPQNAKVTFTNKQIANYYCIPGYEAVGNVFASSCQQDGRWTKVNMMCVKAMLDMQLLIILLAILVFLALFVCVLGITMGKRVYRKRKRRRELESIVDELRRREHARHMALNPYMPLEEQAHLLNYDRRWEFPKNRLTLGKVIGQGAFGRVVKAEAIGILEDEPSTTVAVKMIKDCSISEHLKALVDELKILAYLGPHLNIVNLLGAVTKNVAKGELLVIVEYCRYGNLRNYLLSQRDRFVNQLVPRKEVLDNLIHPQSALQSTEDALVDQPHYSDGKRKKSLHGHCRSSVCRSREVAKVLPPPSISDLLSYAYQCAKGMEFLSSRKLVHRDLAARNVLLAENKVVKICDFGLSRKLYDNSVYVRKGKGGLPMKWMAPESIGDHVFTTKSDVWSFGVLLWEIFSLGATPYPGMEFNEEFYRKLRDGYRMQKPEFAPDAVHDVMRRTWQDNPNDRPDFSNLADELGNLLEEDVKSYYLDLSKTTLTCKGYIEMLPCSAEVIRSADSKTSSLSDDVEDVTEGNHSISFKDLNPAQFPFGNSNTKEEKQL